MTVAVEGVRKTEGAIPADIFVTGSGFAIEPGIVVTNYHVIEDARRITVLLHEGGREAAEIVGTDPGFDLALLRVPFSPEVLPPARLGSISTVRVGQKILTVSSPLGLHHSVTVGVVSSLYRELPGLKLGSNLLQFDAALNPGQSGGPLVDSSGRVIGVTTAKAQPAEGIGFAIPVDVVVAILPALKTMGHAFQPQLGFTGTTVDADLAVLLHLPAKHGVLVESTVDGGVAARAGLHAGKRHVFLAGRDYVLGGDIILEMESMPIRGTGDLVLALLGTHPGEEIHLTVTDGGSPRVVKLTIPIMRH